MAASGKNGTVTSITSTAGGTDATVSFPADPGPPPVPAHVETYRDIPAWAATELRGTNSLRPFADVTVDANGNPQTVKVHA